MPALQPDCHDNEHSVSQQPLSHLNATCLQTAVGPKPAGLKGRPRVGIRKLVEVSLPVVDEARC